MVPFLRLSGKRCLAGRPHRKHPEILDLDRIAAM
jgi:hypothetical protein